MWLKRNLTNVEKLSCFNNNRCQYAYFLLHTQVTIIVKFLYMNKRKKLYALFVFYGKLLETFDKEMQNIIIIKNSN